ncbi:MAG: hypothetical protein M5R40_07565 [Anaerolineae bacterium]|nr:hypothetical protein [Anaerolineae bacterium]
MGTSILSDPGGYYYPDRFGELRAEPDLLARHARQVAAHMAENGAKILWFICHNLKSAAAFAAYDTYAREIDGLLGMFAIQYTPYEGGAGEVFWTQDRNGVNIPVVTARYSIWANARTGNRSGNPEHIAQVINESAARADRQGRSTYEWAIVHAWSYFTPAPGAEPRARGVTPVGWCIERLDPMVKVVTPEELLWRIRMDAYPEETRQIIDMIARHT